MDTNHYRKMWILFCVERISVPLPIPAHSPMLGKDFVQKKSAMSVMRYIQGFSSCLACSVMSGFSVL